MKTQKKSIEQKIQEQKNLFESCIFTEINVYGIVEKNLALIISKVLLVTSIADVINIQVSWIEKINKKLFVFIIKIL